MLAKLTIFPFHLHLLADNLHTGGLDTGPAAAHHIRLPLTSTILGDRVFFTFSCFHAVSSIFLKQRLNLLAIRLCLLVKGDGGMRKASVELTVVGKHVVKAECGDEGY